MLLPLFFGISSDCPLVVNLAKSLHLDRVDPSRMQNLVSDCCTDRGVKCNNENRVDAINFALSKLTGNMESVSFPSTLIWLEVYRNNLTGTIPNSLPDSLTHLYFDVNSFSGSLPNPLPPKLISLHAAGNKLSGPVPVLPTSLVDLSLGYPEHPTNKFTGTLSVRSPIQWLYLYGNLFTDLVVTDSSQLTITSCDFSNNPLNQSTHLQNLKSCRQDGLYSQSDIKSVDNNPNLNSTDSLSSAAIAGIVIGIIAFLLLLFIAFWFKKKQKQVELDQLLHSSNNSLLDINSRPSSSFPSRPEIDNSEHYYSKPGTSPRQNIRDSTSSTLNTNANPPTGYKERDYYQSHLTQSK